MFEVPDSPRLTRGRGVHAVAAAFVLAAAGTVLAAAAVGERRAEAANRALARAIEASLCTGPARPVAGRLEFRTPVAPPADRVHRSVEASR